MGLFSPKISNFDKQRAQGYLKQIQESAKLVNTTVKPDIYFGRLNFLFDLFLRLQPYERYGIFRGGTPSSDLAKLQNGLEKSVDDFIMRSYEKQMEKVKVLKTEKAKKNKP